MKLYRLGEFGVRQRDGYLKKGTVIEGHAHHFNHITAVWGRVRIDVLDKDGNVEKSAEFGPDTGRPIALIRAGTVHRVTVLEDKTTYRCIYTSRDPDGTPIANWCGEDNRAFG